MRTAGVKHFNGDRCKRRTSRYSRSMASSQQVRTCPYECSFHSQKDVARLGPTKARESAYLYLW